tara:strand:+ start:89 stop:829 length:741 start_codon:yes stop_codon:yes gene_type:complete
MNVHLKGIAVVPENAFLISTGNIHNKLIGMNAVHFAAEVNDSETLDLLISQGIPTGLSSRTPTQEDVALNNSTFVQKQEEEKRSRIMKNLENLKSVDDMSVGDLKKSIKSAGLSMKGCVEKQDLQKRAKEGIQNAIDKEEQKRIKKKSKTGAANTRAQQLQGGLTPLHVAAMKGHTDFCRSLVKEGKQVDVNAQDCNGNTALHLAGFAGAQETWDELIRLGVKQRVPNNAGQNAEMAKDLSGCSIM